MLLVGSLVCRRVWLSVAICNARLLFHIAWACCLFACNDFGQHNPSLITHATMTTAYVAHTRHVLRSVPRTCPCTTSIFKHWRMLQIDTTWHTQLEHKARTKALTSSMLVHSRHIQTLAHAANSWHTTQALGMYRDACLVHARAQPV